jgi:teichuronic acid biosynthesis glycosyltransferase TuaC
MKVLFIFSGNSNLGSFSVEKQYAFIFDLVNSYKNYDVEVEYFTIQDKGLSGYLKNIVRLNKHLSRNDYDLVHAFYGLSGIIAVFQKRLPVIITFLGSDINKTTNRLLSYIGYFLCDFNIFVSKQLSNKIRAKRNYAIIPFGVDLKNTFFPLDKMECKQTLQMDPNKRYVLFSSSSKTEVKNYPLAVKSIDSFKEVELIELMKGYTRQQVNLLINACDVTLMTSFSEGSPQVIKEAMACNCPIVSTDVGDVKEIIGGTEGCYITSFDPNDVAEKIKMALVFGKPTKGREKMARFDNQIIAARIYEVYQSVLKNKSFKK